MDYTEKRAHKRYVHAAPIRYGYQILEDYQSAEIRNYSDGGLFFRAGSPLRAGEHIWILLKKRTSGDDVFGNSDGYNAEVCFCNKKNSIDALSYGIGVRFLQKISRYNFLEMRGQAGELRQRAEEYLETHLDSIQKFPSDDVHHLIQELNVHQIELEMQNDELRRAQLEIEASRNRYSYLYDFAPIAYFTFNSKGQILEVNLTGAGMLGVERTRLINTHLSLYVAKEHQEVFRLHRRETFRTGIRQECELRLKKRDGTQIYAHMESSAVLDAEGRISQMLTTLIDITGRKEAEAALRQSETKFRMLFSEMISGCALGEIIFDHSGQTCDFLIRDLNPALERIAGLDKNQVLNKRLLEVLPTAEPYWIEKLGELALTGNPVHFESYHGQLDKYLATAAFRIAAKEIAVTFTDVTDRKHFEIALQKTNDELEKLVDERTAELAKSNASLTQEIAERRRLAYRFLNAQEDERRRIAFELHDELGQDLSLLKLQFDSLNRQLANRKIALKDPIKDLSAILGKTMEKVRRISHELIPPVLLDLGLAAALRWQIQLLKKHSNIAVSSKIRFSADLIPPEQQIVIYRIFQEIFTNIRKHARADHVTISIASKDRRVFFDIEDDGIGCDIERVNSISSAERGLGLAAMEERVKMLDGKFEIFSCIGKGTKIAFEIPITNAP
jgi:PAS domain S-box-containing protein